MSSQVPSDLKYAKSHEWVRVSGTEATVGITDHAQHELTDVVFVELPPIGKKIKAGESCAVVESVKTASDIYSPVSGEVIEINEALLENPQLINEDPYGKGWLFRVRPFENDTQRDFGKLLDADQYTKQVASEAH